jgi:endonuclease/exonuclease/phosphatase family metal-dependent hydrolase
VAQDVLRVMSFNIRYGTARDGVNAWPGRRQHVVSVIRTFGPDLLGTQETLPFQAEQLGQDLPGYQYIGWSRDASADGEQCGIFVKTERFEVQDSGQFWLSETPDEKFSKSWDSSLPRVATWVRLKDRSASGRSLLFFNTHFDHRGVTARRESAAVLVQRAQQLAAGLPVLLTGDFNCGEGSEPWQTLTSTAAGLADSFRTVYPQRSDDEGTFHGFSGRASMDRIDWILCSPAWEVKAASIDRSEFGGRYASDHFAVTATVAWRAK